MKSINVFHEHFGNRFALSNTNKKQTFESSLLTMTIALTMAILMPGRATAQGMPVYDNTNFISMTKSLIESAKQTSELLKTVEFLKEQKENIMKVSDVVKQLRAVKKMADNNRRMIDIVNRDLREILNSPFIKAGEVSRVSNSFNAIIENSLSDLDFIEQILSNDYLKMTDAERTELLKGKEMKSLEMLTEIEAKTRRYREVIAFREMQDIINSREIKY